MGDQEENLSQEALSDEEAPLAPPTPELKWTYDDEDDWWALSKEGVATNIRVRSLDNGLYALFLGQHELATVPTLRQARAMGDTVAWVFRDSLPVHERKAEIDPEESRAVLLVNGGPDDGSSIPIPEGMTLIGRSSLNDLVAKGRGVSRHHAAIRGDDDQFWVSDLGSRNGTFVNGERVGRKPQRLSNRDRIELGGTDTGWLFVERQDTVTVERPSTE